MNNFLAILISLPLVGAIIGYVCKWMAIKMTAIFTVLLTPLLLSAFLLPALQQLGVIPSAIAPVVLGVVHVVVGFVDGAVVFTLVYHGVTNRKAKWSESLPGGVVAGAMFELMVGVFPLYASRSGATSNAAGAFGLVLALLGFFFLIGLIAMIGACVNAEVEARHRQPRRV